MKFTEDNLRRTLSSMSTVERENYLKSALFTMQRSKAFIWKKYFDLIREYHLRTLDALSSVGIAQAEASTQNNTFIQVQLKNAYVELKKMSNCSICLQNVIPDLASGHPMHMTILCCGHLFHAKCIAQWLEENTTCPLCKSDVSNTKVVIDPEVAKAFESREKVDLQKVAEVVVQDGSLSECMISSIKASEGHRLEMDEDVDDTTKRKENAFLKAILESNTEDILTHASSIYKDNMETQKEVMRSMLLQATEKRLQAMKVWKVGPGKEVIRPTPLQSRFPSGKNTKCSVCTLGWAKGDMIIREGRKRPKKYGHLHCIYPLAVEEAE